MSFVVSIFFGVCCVKAIEDLKTCITMMCKQQMQKMDLCIRPRCKKTMMGDESCVVLEMQKFKILKKGAKGLCSRHKRDRNNGQVVDQ
jgi:hypothetical protein